MPLHEGRQGLRVLGHRPRSWRSCPPALFLPGACGWSPARPALRCSREKLCASHPASRIPRPAHVYSFRLPRASKCSQASLLGRCCLVSD